MPQSLNNNKIIRDALKDTGMYKWELADLLGIHCSTLSVWLRHEMPEEKQREIADDIYAFAKAKKEIDKEGKNK